MKKIIFFLFLINGFIYTINAQSIFEYDLKIEKTAKNNKVIHNVTVIMSSGDTPVNYQIMSYGYPNSTPIFESGFTKKTKYKFTNIPFGKYLIKLTDKNGLFAYKPFEIKEE
jgi:hypothetical protein